MRQFILLIAGMALIHADTMGPGNAALEFLGKVRDKSVQLDADGDTAISPHVTETKRREIAKRLDRMASDLKGGELEMGPVKVDGEYAVAIVRKTGGYDPAGLRVFSVGVIKRGDIWRAAPVPASFENAAVGYTVALRKRQDALVTWMLTEQNDDLERSRGVLLERMRHDIIDRITAEQLKSMTVEEIGKTFQQACEAKDIPMLLGLLGGLSSELPEDWSQRLNVVEGLRGKKSVKIRAWRLMSAVEVLRVMVHHETGNGDGLFTIACREPQREDSADERNSLLELFHLELIKDQDGLWRVDPPPPFFEDEPTDGEAGEDDFDNDLLDAFPQKVREMYPTVPAASAEEALLKLRASMVDRSRHSYLSSVDLPDNKAAANVAIRRALSLWWTLNEPGGARYLLPLSFREDGGEAMAVIQVFSAREPENDDLRVLRFVRNKAGWFWQVSDEDNISKQSQNHNLVDWAKMEMMDWHRKWEDLLLTDTVRIEKISAVNAPSSEEAAELIKTYLDALAANDLAKILGKMAWLADARDAERMLRNLGFEISAARQSVRTPEIIGVFQGKHWAAVGIKMSKESTAERVLYPVVMTKNGPKILLEVDIFYARKRGREFLNGAAMDRLDDYADADVVDELRGLYKSFDEKVKSLEGKQSE